MLQELMVLGRLEALQPPGFVQHGPRAHLSFRHVKKNDEGHMPSDIIDHLRLDPGTRTFGQLLQERDWALREIERLREELAGIARRQRHATNRGATSPNHAEPLGAATTALMPHRLIRLSEVCDLVGLSKSSVYKLTAERRFPAPVRITERSVRWRMADVLAWQQGVCDETR
jgi:prophage regulatory protein